MQQLRTTAARNEERWQHTAVGDVWSRLLEVGVRRPVDRAGRQGVRLVLPVPHRGDGADARQRPRRGADRYQRQVRHQRKRLRHPAAGVHLGRRDQGRHRRHRRAGRRCVRDLVHHSTAAGVPACLAPRDDAKCLASRPASAGTKGSIKWCWIEHTCDDERWGLVRTTLALDDTLLAEAQRLTGVQEKTALVREALIALIQRESARRLSRLGGSDPSATAPGRDRRNSG